MREPSSAPEHEPPVSWSDEMTAQEGYFLQWEARRFEHDSRVAWALFALGGFAGLHRLYLSRFGPSMLLGPALLAGALVAGAARPGVRRLAAGLLVAAWLLEALSMPRLLAADRERAERRAQGEQDGYRAGQEQTRAEDEHLNVRASVT